MATHKKNAEAIKKIEARTGLVFDVPGIMPVALHDIDYIRQQFRPQLKAVLRLLELIELEESLESDTGNSEILIDVRKQIEVIAGMLKVSLDKIPHQFINVAGQNVKVIASNIRHQSLDWSDVEISNETLGKEGDLVLAEVTDASGSTRKIEDLLGREHALQNGDKLVVVLGNRHSSTSEFGQIPVDGWNLDETLDLLCHGGIVGRAIEIPKEKGSHPTALKAIGLLSKDGQVLNTASLAPKGNETLLPSAPVIASMGTGAEVGKTTVSAAIIRDLKNRGFRVAATKVAGTGRYRDLLALRDAGADIFFDFADAGLASTYTDPEHYKKTIISLLNRINACNPDIIVAEFGGDIIDANIPTFMTDDSLRNLIRVIVHSAGDVIGAKGSLNYYWDWGYKNPVYFTYPKGRNNQGSKDRFDNHVGLTVFNSLDDRDVSDTVDEIMENMTANEDHIEACNTSDAVLKTTENPVVLKGRNIEKLGQPIAFQGIEKTAQNLLEKLNKQGIVLVQGFSTDPNALYELAVNMGQPTLKYSLKGKATGSPLDYVGDVRFRHDLDAKDRLPTQAGGMIKFHTAHSFSASRPRYFGMLMADNGWTDEPKGKRGESLVISWEDVMEDYRARFPKEFETDIEILMNTPIQYAPNYVKEAISSDPIITKINGTWSGRYWAHMTETVKRLKKDSEISWQFEDAISRLQQVLDNTESGIEFLMQNGELIFIDNRLFVHGRKPYRVLKLDTGFNTYSSRQIYSIHLL